MKSLKLIKKHYLLIFVFALTFSKGAIASNLLIMGDSLSAAYNLRPDQGWVGLLQKKLDAEQAGVSIINASVSGETTQGGVSRFHQLLNDHQPKWVVIELGSNDALRGYPLTHTQNNLETMVRQATAAQAQVLLIGNHIPQNYGKRYAQAFYQLYERIAADNQLEYMPFLLEDVALDKSLMLSDGLHPNADGQKIMLGNIYPYIESLINKVN